MSAPLRLFGAKLENASSALTLDAGQGIDRSLGAARTIGLVEADERQARRR